nr:hypothetical protein [Dyella sp. ASV24]
MKCIARMLAGLFAVVSAHEAMAATLPQTTVEGLHWRIAPAADFSDNATVAARRKEQILVWDNGKDTRVAGEVLLLVDASYDSVQPIVQRALSPFGTFTAEAEKGPLAYLPEGWDQVLLSRRPDLRDALVNRFTLPRLQLAVSQGVITTEEMTRRLAQERARVDSVPQNRMTLDDFHVTYASWYATQKRSRVLSDKHDSTLTVRLFDVTAIFGHPATVVDISRDDNYPNPNAGLFKQLANFNVLSSPPARVVSDGVVPAPVFVAVRDALASLSNTMEIASTPLAWVKPVEPSNAAPPLVLRAPTTDGPIIKAQAIRWDTLVTGPRSLLYPHDLLTLPDGDLLVSAQVSDDTGWWQHVWRFHEANGEWNVENVWRGSAGTSRLSLSTDGRTAWFDGSVESNTPSALIAYDIDAHRVIRHAVNWSGIERSDLQNPRWELAGDQLPTFFRHDYDSLFGGTGDDKNKLGREYFTVMRPDAAPPSTDDTWPFHTAFASARQSMMSVRMKGNTLIWPVRWRDAKVFWVEDQPGLAELDASTGRVLRALALPQRFGTPDPQDATGAAQWVPTPLGSPEAGWIATGFVLTPDDDSQLPSSMRGAVAHHGRIVGMHVVDLKDGHVLSAMLGPMDLLAAAARSAHGRYLVLGSNGAMHSGPRLALWDIAQARTPDQLDASPSKSDVHALAFSWQGGDVWALGDRELFRWHLPDALHDAASPDSAPDQSHP